MGKYKYKISGTIVATYAWELDVVADTIEEAKRKAIATVEAPYIAAADAESIMVELEVARKEEDWTS